MNRYLLISLFLFIYFSSFSQQPKLILPVGHTDRVNSARFSPDGKKIVTASKDNTIKIWDATTSTLIAELKGHTQEVLSAQFSPDGKKIITTSYDKTTKIWDATNGSLIADLKGHSTTVKSAKFSLDGNKIITAPWNGTAKIWDAATGNFLFELKGDSLGVNSAHFSPDGKKIVTASLDRIAKIWDANSGTLLANLKGHTYIIQSAEFSPDGKKIVTASDDHTAKIWDAVTGKLIATLEGHTSWVTSTKFSQDGKKIVTASRDSTAKIWNAATGNLIADVKGQANEILSVQISHDGKKIVTVTGVKYYEEEENNTGDLVAKIWDAATGNLIADLKGHNNWLNSGEFSPDGRKVLTASFDNTAKVWDVATGNLIADLKGHTQDILSAKYSADGKIIISTSKSMLPKIWDAVNGHLIATIEGDTKGANLAQLSPDGKKVVITSDESTAKIYDASTGNIIHNFKGHTGKVNSAQFSQDGKKIVTASSDNTAKIWDVFTGDLITDFVGHTSSVNTAQFSSDGKKIVTASNDSTIKIWNAATGSLITVLKDTYSENILSAKFSPDDKTIITVSGDNYYVSTDYDDDGPENTVNLWDVVTGNLIAKLYPHNTIHNYFVELIEFSPDGKKVLTTTDDGRPTRIWDAATGNLLFELKGHSKSVSSAHFSPDGKKIVTASYDKTIKIWDASSGSLLKDFQNHTLNVTSIEFNPDGKKIIAASEDNTIKVWDAITGKVLYSFFGVDSSDYLIVDAANHYDGTSGARKLLYFTCGTEIIELDQVKDQLWVPNLAERINKGDSINAKTLDQLNICGLTPEVEDASSNNNEYNFKILPRRGGLGETALLINGIEVKRYKPEHLKKANGLYELIIKKTELTNYFIAGKENPVTIKAYTADNAISSRGLIIEEDKTKENVISPNLYAVMVGVSDYKGEELDLKYAAKDATDVSNALSVASKKLLNNDGKEHVFMYNLTTAKDHYQLPEKNSIKKTLEEIGKKATANDILLIFFAGHGVMQGDGDKKQFYFLTADASNMSAGAAADVGISTAELTEWMKPANIKAQKRILIFDACNSGQAIRDFVQLGKPSQDYVAARNDDKGQQIKAIEKLNNQSGLIILAASASDQNAYEMGRYSQGLLTYSLLKVMKQQPEILENGKYLDVSNWLNAAKKMVSSLASETGARQEPQLNTNNNFNIGLIDDEVRSKIFLSSEKPLFARSNFQNTDNKIDNLKIRSAIDKELLSISSRGSDGSITYSADYEGADAYALNGDYKIAGNNISVAVLLTKGGVEVLHRFEATGNTNDINKLVLSITTTVTEWLKNHK